MKLRSDTAAVKVKQASKQAMADNSSNHTKRPIIEGASYYTINPPHKPLYSGWSNGDIISFYTHDGQLLMSSTDFSDINGNKRLDPQAPKPQVAKYQICYWDGIVVAKLPFSKGTLRYAPDGDFIIFFDKHGNGIKSYRYSGSKPPTEAELAVYQSKFDLSSAVYGGYDESARDVEAVDDSGEAAGNSSSKLGGCIIL